MLRYSALLFFPPSFSFKKNVALVRYYTNLRKLDSLLSKTLQEQGCIVSLALSAVRLASSLKQAHHGL